MAFAVFDRTRLPPAFLKLLGQVAVREPVIGP